MKPVLKVVYDGIIVLLVFVTLALGMKYSYVGYNTSQASDQAKIEFRNTYGDNNYINYNDFNPQYGDVIAEIMIENKMDWVTIIEGDSLANLAKGATHLSQTGYPTENRQIFLSAHREYHFNNLKNVQAGDIVVVRMQYGEFRYVIDHTAIVADTDVSVIKTGTLADDELVLMTCYPFSAISAPTQRFLVYAYPEPGNQE